MKKKILSTLLIAGALMLCSCDTQNDKKNVNANNTVSSDETTVKESASETTTMKETTTVKETTTDEETTPPPGKVSLSFTGDIYFSDNLYGYYEAEGLRGFLSDKIIDNLKNADLFIPDHEFVASDRGEMAEYQIYTFRAPASREKLWKEMGADVVTLANNHTLDYGVTALQDTFSLLNDLGIDYVGAGNTLSEALKPCIKEVNGKKIAIFGSTRFVPQGFWYVTESNPGLLTTYESTPYYGYICDAIAKAKKECDYVLIYVHFGEEKQHTVAPYQQTVAHGYLDAGADLVVGTHPHVLQGIEFYKGKPIIYSLGNFLFSNYHSDTVVLNVTVNEDNSSSVNLLPCSSQLYKTTDIDGSAARQLFDFIEGISFDIKIDDNGNVTPVS